MSVLGKILALLNIVAAAVFFYVAVMDYGRHKNWSYAIGKMELAHQGLPTDDKETDVQGQVRVEDFDEFTIKSLPQLDGQPLTNQEKAMRDLEKKIKQKVDSTAALQPHGLPAPLTTKEQKLAWVLRPLATSFARRNALYRVMIGQEPNLLDAVGIFDSTRVADGKCAYDVEIAPRLADLEKQFPAPEKEELRDRSEEEKSRRKLIAEAIPARLEKDFAEAFAVFGLPEKERRLAFAHLMFAMCSVLEEDGDPTPSNLPESKSFANLIPVIGLQAVVDQMNIRIDMLRRMVYECELQLERERNLFVEEHNAKLARIRNLMQLHARLVKQRAIKEKDIDDQKKLNEEQQAVIDRVEQELAKARADTGVLLKDKAIKENEILSQQKELRGALGKVQSLAKDLRNLEEKFPRREAQPR
jgi:hypothetical protein